MRITVAAVFLFACHPSASVQRTMPVANLQTYHSVGLRISAVPQAQGQAYYLEQAVLARLHQSCGFESIARAGAAPNDLILDLNVVGAGRGGSGWITNANLATIDTLLVLSDGSTGELLGSARIHGQSSQMAMSGSNPEQQAVDVVAQTIGDMLGKSGCAGPRLAKATPPPVTTPPGPGPEPARPRRSPPTITAPMPTSSTIRARTSSAPRISTARSRCSSRRTSSRPILATCSTSASRTRRSRSGAMRWRAASRRAR